MSDELDVSGRNPSQDGTKKEKHPKVYAFVDAPVEIHWIERGGELRRVDMVRFNETGEAS